MKPELIQYNKDNFSGLSARSKLIIYRLGGIEKTLEYYRLRGTFVNQKNIGSSTSSELSLYLDKYLININSNIDISLNNNDNMLENIVKLYNKLKANCSVRTKNVLNKLESLVSINFTNDDWIYYIRKYFICNYNFLEIPKIGEKGLIEFNYLKESISNRVLEIGQDLSIENPFYIIVNDQSINLQISESSWRERSN